MRKGTVRDMKKKIMTVAMSLMMCFSMAACGGGEDKKKDDGIDPNATVTKEQYDKLRETKWYELTPEEIELLRHSPESGFRKS